MNENQEAPVKAGEVHDVTINAVGEKGDGIARVNGFVVFVPNVKRGDYVKIKITKVLPKVGFAEVVEKMERPQNPKFATIRKEDFHKVEEQRDLYTAAEDTEDFGEESH